MDGVLRERIGTQRVTFVELFFDLVYVFAVTQLSHLLLSHLDLHTAAQTSLLLLAVWWAWVYTTWFTNWFHPDHRVVRMVLVGVMLTSLIMSAALPTSFGAHGLLFAAAYTTLQVGRTLFASLSVRNDRRLRRNLQRVLVWMLFSGVCWIAGGTAGGTARELLWLLAIGLDYGAPTVRFATPGLGRSAVEDWTIDGAHLAERCQLFIIIALGESILVTGATLGSRPLAAGSLTAFVAAFALSVSLWWLYFDRSAEAAAERIASARTPGRLARSAYTYFHLPLVAGIILTAVGDELVIAHPLAHPSRAAGLAVLGGPALFLVGHALFKYAVFSHCSVRRLLGAAAVAALGLLGQVLPLLALTVGATTIIALVGALDAGARTPSPSPETEVVAATTPVTGAVRGR